MNDYMTDIELAKECLSTYETQGYFPHGEIYSFPKLLSSLITTIEYLQGEVKKYKWEDEQFSWLQEQIKTCSSENTELNRQIESQKEEIEVYRSSLQSISDNTKDSGSFIAAQSALNKAKRLQKGGSNEQT